MNTKQSCIAVFLVSFLLLAGCNKNKPATATVPAAASAPATASAPAADSTPARRSRASVSSIAVPAAKTVRVGPAKLYPDTTLTTGVSATLNAADLTKRYTVGCTAGKTDCTYSDSHRNVSDAVHKQVYDEYKVPTAKRNINNGEVDHLYPMCAGGSNDIKNLWYQPAVNMWKGKNFGYHEKDHLETWVCSQIKDHKLEPKEAYDRITKDWVAFYLDQHLDQSKEGPDSDID
jgi:hypothetical protein